MKKLQTAANILIKSQLLFSRSKKAKKRPKVCYFISESPFCKGEKPFSLASRLCLRIIGEGTKP